MSCRIALRVVALLALLALAGAAPVRGQDPKPSRPPTAADYDSSAALRGEATPAVEPYRPSPALDALRDLRIALTADLQTIDFGDPDDPIEQLAKHTLADHLRLLPSVRTRELSQGPTQESFELDGSGSARQEMLIRGTSLRVPGASGPQSHEVMMSELRGFSLVRGGASAFYGPDAVGGALVLHGAQPIPEQLQVRIVAEEGSDDFLRAAFHVEKPFGENWGAFLDSETRIIEGFFPGTSESDRFLSMSMATRLPSGLEAGLSWRHYEGDGRHNGFDPALIEQVLTDRDDIRFDLFRGHGDGRGTLLELAYVAQDIRNGIGGSDSEQRVYRAPSLRITSDLRGPSWLTLVGRIEGSKMRVTSETDGVVRTTWRGAGVLRAIAGEPGRLVGLTGRVDGEETRRPAWHARLEGAWQPGALGAFAIGTHGERWPEPGAAAAGTNERVLAAQAGLKWHTSSLRVRALGWVSRIRSMRRDPVFDEIRARDPVLDAPVGDGEMQGVTAGLETDVFAIPGAAVIGRWQLSTSATSMTAENATTGTRLSGRPRFLWVGEGSWERGFFREELGLRVRGRLTHWHDRLDDALMPVVDLWLTDVVIEGAIGDAVLYVRFLDTLERADEVEPGIRFPGFTIDYGLTWRFRG